MEYKYDAFISYRHCELDKFTAENLHKLLENYKLPKNVKEKLNIDDKKIKRVFRDLDELPLSSNLEDNIVEALKNSKYLIVICSPRLKESLWCKKEIEMFKKLRGIKNIFCVLIEGEPSDSFPEEVLYEEKKIVKDGKTKKEKVLVEPLAADVRGNNKKQILKKLKSEKLRLIAPMYDLAYDDLKQRHRQRRQKKIIITSLIVAISCSLLFIYTAIMLIKISNQQKILKLHQAETLSSKSLEYLNEDKRYDAIKSAYQSLTKFHKVKMPYTSDAEYALVESLGLYDVGSSYKAITELKTDGIAKYIKSSDNKKYALVYDESEKLTLFDTKKLNTIKTFNLNDSIKEENLFTFIGNDIMAYINEKGNISLINTKDGKLLKEIDKKKNNYTSLQGDSEGKYLSYIDDKKLYIYNIKENKTITSISYDDKLLKEIYFSNDNKYIFVSTTNDNINLEEEDYVTVHTINIKDKKEITSVELNTSEIAGMLTKGDNLYILSNRLMGRDYNMLVVSYNYIDDDINWTKKFDRNFGKFITQSYPDDTNHIAIVNYQTINVLDTSNGDIVETFNADDEIINIYSFLKKELYLVFLKNGSVNYADMENRNLIEYTGKYQFNVDEYDKVALSKNGFLLIPKNDNRVILYEAKTNKNVKEENIKIDYEQTDYIARSKYDKLKEKYNVKNQSLVEYMFYSDKKDLLFVSYTNGDLVTYNTKTKKLLSKIKTDETINKYYGKDKYNRTYVGGLSHAYILDQNYNKVGHIKNLYKLEKDKVLIQNNDKCYSVKIYNYNEVLKEAEEYLK